MKSKSFELSGVTVRKGSSILLQEIDLELEEGLTYALMGPNGSGKTSLLRLLNFLELPAEGQMCYCGEEIRGADLICFRRQMAFVTQDPVMFNCSVFENVAIGLKFRNVPRPEMKKRVEEILERLSLTTFRRRNARTLSGGERQKVSMARALVLCPKVLLLDEPTANLDKDNQAEIEGLIAEAGARGKTTVVIATHEAEQAKKLAGEVIYLKKGEISRKGDVSSVLGDLSPDFL